MVLRLAVVLALLGTVPSCITLGASAGAAADSPGLALLGITLGAIGDSFLVIPLDGTVDHDIAWVSAMGIDLIITAVLYNVAYHGHQVH